MLEKDVQVYIPALFVLDRLGFNLILIFIYSRSVYEMKGKRQSFSLFWSFCKNGHPESDPPHLERNKVNLKIFR